MVVVEVVEERLVVEGIEDMGVETEVAEELLVAEEEIVVDGVVKLAAVVEVVEENVVLLVVKV